MTFKLQVLTTLSSPLPRLQMQLCLLQHSGNPHSIVTVETPFDAKMFLQNT